MSSKPQPNPWPLLFPVKPPKLFGGTFTNRNRRTESALTSSLSVTPRPAPAIRLRGWAGGICARRADTSSRRWRPTPPCDGGRREQPFPQGFQAHQQEYVPGSNPLFRPTTVRRAGLSGLEGAFRRPPLGGHK